MRALYTALLYLLTPFVLARLFWRGRRRPALNRRWRERFGRVEAQAGPAPLWLHAVSVGEAQAAAPLVSRLLEGHPGLPILITTTTATGAERVQTLFGERVRHLFFPYDLPFALRAFLHRVQPRALVMMETEIWPNLLAACAESGIPTLLANARLSERSARGYARLGGLTRETMGRITCVAAQDGRDGARFVRLGVPAARVRVTGSIKFDQRIPPTVIETAEVLRRQIGDRPVWVAGSTHEGEEELILSAHAALLKTLPSALLILAPRHPERFERVAGLCRLRGFHLVQRSGQCPCPAEAEVFLGDTMGELPLFYAASQAAFVGGSLIRRGGHNPLEPAALGVPVILGPHTFNFAAISELLIENGGAVRVRSAEGLTELLTAWLSDASTRARTGENARRVVEANRGAVDRLYELLAGFLPDPPEARGRHEP